jgi:indole-3-glycerol phosphate synthase
MNRLTEIINHKRTEIEPLLGYTADWRERARQVSTFRGFKNSLSADSFGIIAEVKKASPSAGVIAKDFDPVKTALAYDKAGTDCISVLTDEKYFHGHLDYLALIREQVPRPLDLRATETLAPLIPSGHLVISESGIRSAEDIRRVVGAGVHGALIGESLMRAENPRDVLESFRAAALASKD